jgi:hypothetical protein
MKDLSITDMSTYTSVPKQDGAIHVEGLGVLLAQTGEMGTYTFRAVAQPTSDAGGLNAHGELLISAPQPNGKLSYLNKAVCVFRTEIDTMGNTHTRTWSIDVPK